MPSSVTWQSAKGRPGTSRVHFLYWTSSIVQEGEKKLLVQLNKYEHLPRLTGQMANTIMSVGKEQRRSSGKFLLETQKIFDQYAS